MVTTHNLGFPRIGAHRELKFALETFWNGQSSIDSLEETAAQLRARHWRDQSALDLIPVGDFSLYDHVLDMSVTLSNLPARACGFDDDDIHAYFRAARGRSAKNTEGHVAAGEMTKWFDTNYHYIVPELDAETQFQLNATRLLTELAEAKKQGVTAKPVLLGPVSYLALGKSKDGSHKLTLLKRILPVYASLLAALARAGATWVQVDEPILVTELDDVWQNAFIEAYRTLDTGSVKILLTTYFGQLKENLAVVARLPVQGIHIDTVNARDEVNELIKLTQPSQVISLGVVNGRNIWKTDLDATLVWLEPLSQKLGSRLWLAPHTSLLHVPVDLTFETGMDAEIRAWMAFAVQKIAELKILADALTQGRGGVATALAAHRDAVKSRRESARVNNEAVKAATREINASLGQRRHNFETRAARQAEKLNLPLYPTTTIGSFPQTQAIRMARTRLKKGLLDDNAYKNLMRQEIQHCVREQEKLGLDVLVHGEAERNDMVEYFGEQLRGFTFSQNGWVQSYGSRCVKPPILFGDISRPKPMTVEWITYAASLTDKPMKGMLTGPVTILNWSFVRDDQPRATTCYQLALAIRQEVLDLEKAGIHIIQIDEAALREGLPLRRSQWKEYLSWAVESFRIAANGVTDETQIHTHMCYSEFNDIIAEIAEMDADVITIETSRSDMELLNVFETFDYPNQIGPGVYDIHAPNIPETPQIISLMLKAGQRIPAARLWINPDCGLKTRQWQEVIPALTNMVNAARALRADAASHEDKDPAQLLEAPGALPS